jgi:hypothetical protein
MEANRDALGQAYPGEDGIDGGDPLTVGLRVRDVDGAGDAVDVTAHYLIAAHQLDLSRISHPDRSKVRLLEISVEVPAQKGLSSSSQKATNRAMHTAAHRRSPNSSEGTLQPPLPRPNSIGHLRAPSVRSGRMPLPLPGLSLTSVWAPPHRNEPQASPPLRRDQFRPSRQSNTGRNATRLHSP